MVYRFALVSTKDREKVSDLDSPGPRFAGDA
jgi:hypothetical protein